ncbi:MAG: 23S rRNA (pseudouridine(1915)-N(3))-methyltransferase RlmH [Pseudomonadota bacterium]|nr:23S rRNA (pseudouridine(1915)-N(3))-methyltransferase RlmH [Pseudomonadota bacterium]
MSVKLIAVGRNMPDWVNTAFSDYVKRLPSDFKLELTEIKAEHRGKSEAIAPIIQREGEKLLAAVPSGHITIALDERGQQWSTQELANRLHAYRLDSRKICLLIGGPDGLSDQCREQADSIWSLSKLTLPHPLVRVMIAEQIYRAWSILNHHPYHRD